MTPRLRFAPSPNGSLHLGHALSALANEQVAARIGGALLLRIEDIDRGRSRPEHERAIRDDLAWLGLAWDEPPLRQSTRMEAYGLALARLEGLGLLYSCYATRSEIAAAQAAGGGARDPDGAPLYPGLHRDLSPAARQRLLGEGRRAALRIDMARAVQVAAAMPDGIGLSWCEDGAGPDGQRGTIAADPLAWGDVIVARRDTPTSYHLSVVVDDAMQGITHVVRGRDLFHATAIHRLLQVLLGYPAPRYLHHRLLLDRDGGKLSKSRGSPGLGALRDEGVTAQALRASLLADTIDGPDAPPPFVIPSGAKATR